MNDIRFLSNEQIREAYDTVVTQILNKNSILRKVFKPSILNDLEIPIFNVKKDTFVEYFTEGNSLAHVKHHDRVILPLFNVIETKLITTKFSRNHETIEKLQELTEAILEKENVIFNNFFKQIYEKYHDCICFSKDEIAKYDTVFVSEEIKNDEKFSKSVNIFKVNFLEKSEYLAIKGIYSNMAIRQHKCLLINESLFSNKSIFFQENIGILLGAESICRFIDENKCINKFNFMTIGDD